MKKITPPVRMVLFGGLPTAFVVRTPHITRKGMSAKEYFVGFPLHVQSSAHGRRGNRRRAAGGGRSEAISRKCPDWRPRQRPGIGWHDGEHIAGGPAGPPHAHGHQNMPPACFSRCARALSSLCPLNAKNNTILSDGVIFWSGRRGSNSLPRPWQGRALPDELRPQNNGYYSA